VKNQKPERDRRLKELARVEEQVTQAEADVARIGAEIESGLITDRLVLAALGRSYQAAEDRLDALMIEWESLQSRGGSGG